MGSQLSHFSTSFLNTFLTTRSPWSGSRGSQGSCLSKTLCSHPLRRNQAQSMEGGTTPSTSTTEPHVDGARAEDVKGLVVGGSAHLWVRKVLVQIKSPCLKRHHHCSLVIALSSDAAFPFWGVSVAWEGWSIVLTPQCHPSRAGSCRRDCAGSTEQLST